jgi:hypothetical protein
MKVSSYNGGESILVQSGFPFFQYDTSVGFSRGIKSFDTLIVPTVQAGVWYNLAVAVNGTTVRTYVNGIAGPTQAYGRGPLAWTELSIGDSNYANGSISFGEILTYNKALSPAEVLQNYQSKAHSFTNTPPTPTTASYIHANVGYPCGNGPSGVTLYSATPAGVGTVFYLDPQMTFRTANSWNIGGIDYDIHGSGTAVSTTPYCD